jgi:hypothetical protein
MFIYAVSLFIDGFDVFLCVLQQQYGDHLYDEKDFDGSIVQYCHTIGYIPSSSVIT